MAISSEIEKLERRWNENPSGLMFAPLAEAYRKAGNQARALELLEHGLRVHPDYVPALIVRGRCHLETGGVQEAESAFEQALTRDPVNAIALRGLADVYERAGRHREAAERLTLLLEVDRGDAEAREALERLRQALTTAVREDSPASSLTDAIVEDLEVETPMLAAEAAVGAAPTEERPQAAEGELAPEAPVSNGLGVESEEMLDLTLEAPPHPIAGLEVENLSVDPMLTEEAEPAPSTDRLPWEPVPEARSLWGGIEITTAKAPEPEAVASEPIQAPALPGPVLWTPAPVEEAAAVPALVDPPMATEPDLELAEPGPSSEPQTMEIAESDGGVVPPESPEAAAVSWPTIEVSAASQELQDSAEPAESEPDSETPGVEAETAGVVAEAELPPPAAEEPELIVTESMAEVFLRQGHKSLALAVYRQLAERSPGSASIGEAIAYLEGELAPVAVPVPEAAEPTRVTYLASETGGRSVGQLLRTVLNAPPPVAASTVLPPAIEPAGEPTRATPDALSLGAVFGDESAPVSSVVEERAAEEPSYDEFFGAAPAAEVAAGGPVRTPESEDLRQFNEWLRGLKR